MNKDTETIASEEKPIHIKVNTTEIMLEVNSIQCLELLKLAQDKGEELPSGPENYVIRDSQKKTYQPNEEIKDIKNGDEFLAILSGDTPVSNE